MIERIEKTYAMTEMEKDYKAAVFWSDTGEHQQKCGRWACCEGNLRVIVEALKMKSDQRRTAAYALIGYERASLRKSFQRHAGLPQSGKAL